METHIEKLIIEKINTLFITNRKSYLEQYGKGEAVTYRTVWYTLSDGVVAKHLKHKKTIGVRLGDGGLTKFLTFDVDILDVHDCRQTTLNLVDCLIDIYGISLGDIHVSISGLKGYHVDLYFDDVIREKELEAFYFEVLEYLGETTKRIERRPTTSYGVKLPMGFHRKSRVLCCYVNNQTLEPLPYNHILSIKQMSLDEFKESILNDCNKSVDIKKNISNKNTGFFNEVNFSQKEVAEVFNTGHLIRSNSRDAFTFRGAIWLKEQGYSETGTRSVIFEIIENTLANNETRCYISSKSLTRLKKETSRVVRLVYDRDYKIIGRKKEISLYKNEIDLLLEKVKRTHHLRLAFSMLVHSKLYADDDGVFYFPYSSMERHGIGKNRTRVLTYIQYLEELGILEIVSRDNSGGNMCKKPNKYRMLIQAEKGDGVSYTIKSEGELSLETVRASLYDKEELAVMENKQDKIIYYL
ncbi:DNA primase [Candidatus Enterococcus clewellii]|uniref:DNA primase n=1 Tax=Candidatus Enterococcus clewellii TaxID=1834193 RepID=A0AAQ3VSX0_9ENTE